MIRAKRQIRDAEFASDRKTSFDVQVVEMDLVQKQDFHLGYLLVMLFYLKKKIIYITNIQIHQRMIWMVV